MVARGTLFTQQMHVTVTPQMAQVLNLLAVERRSDRSTVVRSALYEHIGAMSQYLLRQVINAENGELSTEGLTDAVRLYLGERRSSPPDDLPY